MNAKERAALVVGDGPAVPIIVAALSHAGAAVDTTAGDRHHDIVVHAHLAPESLTSRPLLAYSPEEWDAAAEAPVRAALHTAQAAHRQAAQRLIFVCPTVALEGAAGFVALASATEAVRMLAKSAARRWAATMTVNVVAPALVDLVPTLAGTDAARTLPARPGPAGTALGPTVVWLASPEAEGITGATIPVDGGAVMVP